MLQFDNWAVNKDSKVTLGFSGGNDSLAAAHFLARGGWDVSLFHVRHFNTAHSDRIAHGVELAAHSLSLPLEIYDGTVFDMPPSEGNAYVIRDRAITSRNSSVIVCSHLNDMGESYFMNMCSGHVDRIPLRLFSGNKVRPFLRTRRAAFERYVMHNGLSSLVVPDDMKSERGRLRREVFPVIGQDFASLCKRLYIDTGKYKERDT
jgi:tRNA(Ile)-lysidine synthase TilS/MesJ